MYIWICPELISEILLNWQKVNSQFQAKNLQMNSWWIWYWFEWYFTNLSIDSSVLAIQWYLFSFDTCFKIFRLSLILFCNKSRISNIILEDERIVLKMNNCAINYAFELFTLVFPSLGHKNYKRNFPLHLGNMRDVHIRIFVA